MWVNVVLTAETYRESQLTDSDLSESRGKGRVYLWGSRYRTPKSDACLLLPFSVNLKTPQEAEDAMYKEQGQLLYSPSDLTCYTESPFASWMDRYRLEQPTQAPEKDPDDPLMRVLQSKGYAHEDAFESDFAAKGKSVIKIEQISKLPVRQ